MKTKSTLPVGTAIPINIDLSSPGGTYELTADIKIDNPSEKSKEKEVTVKQEYSLPQLIEVYKENLIKNNDSPTYWHDLNWTELDICKVQESSQESVMVDAIYVNMEPRELDNYIRSRKIAGENVGRVTRTYKTTVYLLSLVLYYELCQRLKAEQETSDDDAKRVTYEPVEMVSFMMKGLAKILLHITTNESLLKEIDNVQE